MHIVTRLTTLRVFKLLVSDDVGKTSRMMCLLSHGNPCAVVQVSLGDLSKIVENLVRLTITSLSSGSIVGDPFERPISNRPNGSTADMSPYSIDQVSIHLLRKSGPYDQYPYS
ncbi:hypothetical protein Peur_051365 [Populus x canadensis]